MRQLLTGLIIGAAFTAATAYIMVPPIPPYIGHDCYDSGGDLFAFDESDFPACEMIERNR